MVLVISSSSPVLGVISVAGGTCLLHGLGHEVSPQRKLCYNKEWNEIRVTVWYEQSYHRTRAREEAACNK